MERPKFGVGVPKSARFHKFLRLTFYSVSCLSADTVSADDCVQYSAFLAISTNSIIRDKSPTPAHQNVSPRLVVRILSSLTYEYSLLSSSGRTQLLESPRYWPEVGGFDSRLDHWDFSVTRSFLPYYGPGVDSSLTEMSTTDPPWRVKGAGA